MRLNVSFAFFAFFVPSRAATSQLTKLDFVAPNSGFNELFSAEVFWEEVDSVHRYQRFRKQTPLLAVWFVRRAKYVR